MFAQTENPGKQNQKTKHKQRTCVKQIYKLGGSSIYPKSQQFRDSGRWISVSSRSFRSAERVPGQTQKSYRETTQKTKAKQTAPPPQENPQN